MMYNSNLYHECLDRFIDVINTVLHPDNISNIHSDEEALDQFDELAAKISDEIGEELLLLDKEMGRAMHINGIVRKIFRNVIQNYNFGD